MTIELNGERVELGTGSTVADAVARAGARETARGLAVALDGEVVPRSRWHEIELRSGQVVEVLQAMQGG